MPQIDEIIVDVQKRLTLEGKKRVFEDGRELGSNDIVERQDPEEFTRNFLIDKILFEIFELDLTGSNRKFQTPDGERKVDYAVRHEDLNVLIEAKPINADLELQKKDGAVNQIVGVFRLVEVEELYDYGVATDGIAWIFINKEREIIDRLTITENFGEIRKYLKGEEPTSQEEARGNQQGVLRGIQRHTSRSQSYRREGLPYRLNY